MITIRLRHCISLVQKEDRLLKDTGKEPVNCSGFNHTGRSGRCPTETGWRGLGSKGDLIKGRAERRDDDGVCMYVWDTKVGVILDTVSGVRIV